MILCMGLAARQDRVKAAGQGVRAGWSRATAMSGNGREGTCGRRY
jgi:hypothetical protein